MISVNNRNRVGSVKVNSLAVVRADDMSKVKTALCDLIRYAHLVFADKARVLEPVFADNILISVMKSPLKMCCKAASIVPLEDDASAAIGRLRKIHPPAHIIIVSPRHEIFGQLAEYIDILPEINLNLEWDDEDDGNISIDSTTKILTGVSAKSPIEISAKNSIDRTIKSSMKNFSDTKSSQTECNKAAGVA